MYVYGHRIEPSSVFYSIKIESRLMMARFGVEIDFFSF